MFCLFALQVKESGELLPASPHVSTILISVQRATARHLKNQPSRPFVSFLLKFIPSTRITAL